MSLSSHRRSIGYTASSHLQDGDFYLHERYVKLSPACEARIEHVSAANGSDTVLRPKLSLQAGNVLEASYLDCALLCDFYEEFVREAQASDVLFSIHLKVYFKDLFAKYKDTFAEHGVNAYDGQGDVYQKIANHLEKETLQFADFQRTFGKQLSFTSL